MHPLQILDSVRRNHAGYVRGDWDAAMAVVHPEAEFEFLVPASMQGGHRGHARIRAVMGDWIQAWERGSIRFEADLIVVTPPHAFAYCTHVARGRTSGAEVTVRTVQAWSFAEDGLARRLVSGDDGGEVLAAAGTEVPAHVQAMLDAEAARLRGDVEGALAIFADDVEFHGVEHGPLAGPHRGREGVVHFFTEWLSAFEQHESRLRVLIDLGDRLVTEAPQRGRSRGLDVAMVSVGSWWLRDGKVVLVRWFDSVEEALAVTT